MIAGTKDVRAEEYIRTVDLTTVNCSPYSSVVERYTSIRGLAGQLTVRPCGDVKVSSSTLLEGNSFFCPLRACHPPVCEWIFAVRSAAKLL